MKPTEKSQGIENLLTSMLGGTSRKDCIEGDVCVPRPIGCGGPATEFRNTRSEAEYRISGMCQKCQDEFFGKD